MVRSRRSKLKFYRKRIFSINYVRYFTRRSSALKHHHASVDEFNQGVKSLQGGDRVRAAYHFAWAKTFRELQHRHGGSILP